MDAKRIDDLLNRALDLGAESAEAFSLHGTSTEIEVSNLELEMLKVSEDVGIGLRILTPDRRLGFAYTSDLTETGLRKLVEETVSNGKVADPDPHNSLSAATESRPLDFPLADPELAEVSTEKKIQIAMEVEKAARDFDSRVDKVRYASYHDSHSEIYIANTFGLQTGYEPGACSTSVMTVAGENGER